MRSVQLIVKLSMTLFILTFLALISIICASYLLGPPPIENTQTTILLDATENVINQETQNVSLEEISPYVVDATILIEDQHFYQHHGFDYRGIIRAIYKNIRAKRLKEGASTITQQLARNLYLSHEKTWIRKLKEAFYTIRIEMFYTKEEILHAYLNEIYYGHGSYGIEAASNYYFQKKASELSLAEAALLVGIPKGPSYYSPFVNLEQATKRQHYILQELRQAGKITEAEYHTAKNEQLQFANRQANEKHPAAYFIDVVWQEAEAIFGEERASLKQKGLVIYTTLDAALQRAVDQLVQEKLPQDSELQVALMTMNPKTGAILQLTGGKDYATSPFNRVTQAKRMVGSTFKPFLYYAALEKGFTASTMLTSEPTAFKVAETMYEPKNFNGYYAYQPISLAQALALSDNIYAVKTHLFLGPKQVVETARKFGITAKLPEVPALALGSASISLKEMVQAYSVLANGGAFAPAYTIEKITDRAGNILYQKEQQQSQVLDAKKAFVLTKLMTGMFDRRLNGYMEVTGASISDQLTHEYAGKSGTTEADHWMIGFSAALATGVWIGYDDNRPIERYKEKVLAKELWSETIEMAHQFSGKKNVTFKKPKGIVTKIIDIETGMLATEHCQTKVKLYFERGTEPQTTCQQHEGVVLQVEKQEDAKKSLLKRLLPFLRE